MQPYNGPSTILEKNRYVIPPLRYEEEVKTTSEVSLSKKIQESFDVPDKRKFWNSTSIVILFRFLTLSVIGILIWSLLWSTWGSGWAWTGPWFRVAAVPAVAWASGVALHELTSLPPLLAALLTGILARYLNILDIREHTDIDALLRKIYPVAILGKASLGWNLSYMRANWVQVAPMGILPWTMEVITLATCTHFLLDFPWVWGFLFGSIYASVSSPVVMPSVIKHGRDGTRNWVQIVSCAGGFDTGLSVGVYGVLYSYIFYNTSGAYPYVKAALTLLVGGALGAIWGSFAKFTPRAGDYYVSELRVLFVFVGGLACNFLTGRVGWVGVGVVAVLICNATAAHHWARAGWKLNDNPASTAYRVIWATLEPIVFSHTGTYIVLNGSMSKTLLIGFGILLICVTVRLSTMFLACRGMTVRERLFMCCTWSPKSIVEAVLSPLALNTLLSTSGHSAIEHQTAERIVLLMVQAILITTPIGFLLTKYLGAILLKPNRNSENETNT